MIYFLSIMLFIMCCVALGLWVWAGGVHSDYLEAKWESDYYYQKWAESVAAHIKKGTNVP
jgi:hypothetical protein